MSPFNFHLRVIRSQLDYMPFDASLKRTQATLQKKGESGVFKVTKGAPNVVLDMCGNKSEIQSAVDDKVRQQHPFAVMCFATTFVVCATDCLCNEVEEESCPYVLCCRCDADSAVTRVNPWITA